MKSNKQRRSEILNRRRERAAAASKPPVGKQRPEIAVRTAACNPELLAPYNSYGHPPFVERGFYADLMFKCQECGKEEVWRATQQKWWYEVAKGNVETRAIRCNACRRAERERRADARRVHMEGVERKKNALE